VSIAGVETWTKEGGVGTGSYTSPLPLSSIFGFDDVERVNVFESIPEKIEERRNLSLSLLCRSFVQASGAGFDL
jgi:hypothetical protein